MSFKGLITRKDKDTGVTLLAKVVSPNRKKSQKKMYRIRVIASGISDREACNRDLIFVKNSFYEQGIDDLENNLNFIPIGPNGTSITYNLVNDSEDSPLTDYLDKNTGKILGKPLYGHDDASGRIQITVTKGEESLTGVVNVVIKAHSSFEILHNADLVNAYNLWVAIANGDTPYYLSHGKINLIQEWTPWIGLGLPPSDTPIQVTWEIEDKLLKSNLIEQARISQGNTEIYTPDYTHFSSILNNGSASFSGVDIQEGISYSYSEYDKVLKANGLLVTATLTLGEDAVKLEPFDIYTNSEALSNNEVITEIINNSKELSSGAKESTIFEVYDASTGSNLGGYIVYGTNATVISNKEQVTHIDASKVTGTKFTIRILSSQSLERVALPKLLIAQGKLAGTISNVAGTSAPVFAFNGADEYAPNPVTVQSVFSWTTRDEASSDILLVIDLAQIKALVDAGDTEKANFCLKQTLTISKYNDVEKFTTINRQFVIDNIQALVTTD